MRGARDELLALADTVGAPIGHTLRGKEWIQYDNPFDVGMTGCWVRGPRTTGSMTRTC
ncbi:hypothetical protein GS907_26410 [Rhodococcus hoagii]|nr:hypothetical protein [Prescottella equi]